MIELAQHIEALLLENDCVIVPGLGGFVAHYTPAMRVAEENTFLPPTRIIGFNPQLKMNDGLLSSPRHRARLKDCNVAWMALPTCRATVVGFRICATFSKKKRREHDRYDLTDEGDR